MWYLGRRTCKNFLLKCEVQIRQSNMEQKDEVLKLHLLAGYAFHIFLITSLIACHCPYIFGALVDIMFSCVYFKICLCDMF